MPACRTLLRLVLLSSAAVPAVAGAQAPAVEEIVVTGSRIPRPNLTAVQPLQVIQGERLDQRGFINLADALNEEPTMGVPVSPISDQATFGTGRNFVNLNNLGSNRTLVLVNGRRFVGGNPASIFTGAPAGEQVDLNLMPTAFVERIEIVQAGGSAVYGSDAVAGVVNIVTRSAFDGLEADVRYGQADGYDDWRGRLAAGRTFGRLNLMASYEYSRTSALSFADRDFGAEQLAFAANPANTSASDNVPGAILIADRRIPETTLGGLPFRLAAGANPVQPLTILSSTGARVSAQFGPGGALIPYDAGRFYQSGTASGGEGLDLAPFTSLVAPVERHVATGFATYNFSENVRAKAEWTYAKVNSSEAFNQPIMNAPVLSGTSSFLTLSTSNPFLPAASRAAILAQPTPLTPDPRAPGEVVFQFSRTSPELGTNGVRSTSETFRGLLALEGDFEVAARPGFWNLSYNQGQIEGRFSSSNINQVRFTQAVDVIRDAAGAPVCRDVTARAAGCAPLNLFGQGAPSAAALAWIGVDFVTDFKILQTVYEANAGLDVAQLPAGPWQVVAGLEARYAKSDFSPNEAQRGGVGRQAAITSTTGKFDTQELYVETRVPLLGGDVTLPLVEQLEVEGAWRAIDHSRAGKDHAWSMGGRWTPTSGITFRAQRGRSFRAPAVTELFLPRATVFHSGVIDPCDARNIGGGPSPTARRANCEAAFQALGLPTGFQLTAQTTNPAGTNEGNPNLENETARQWSAGVVVQPHPVPGLEFTFDWTEVRITDAISAFTLTNVLQACYDGGDPAACSRFQRGRAALTVATRRGQVLATGEAVGDGSTAAGAATSYVNAGYVDFQGFTAAAKYGADLGPARLDFDLQVVRLKRLETSINGLGSDLNRDQGEIGAPKWRWKLESAAEIQNLRLLWVTSWIGASRFNNDFTFEGRYPLGVDDYFLHDAAVSYDLDAPGLGLRSVRAQVAVRNLFDKAPPYGAVNPDARATAGTYDALGRYVQASLTARF